MNAPKATPNGQAVLQGIDLARHYDVKISTFGGHATVRALAGASFELEAGRTLAVVGESGCGKSTLARLVTLIEKPTTGQLLIDGTDVAQASREDLKKLRQDTGERAVVFDKDTAVSPNVLDHIITAWGVMSKRNFARAPAQDKLWVSVGLSNTHYYVSGGVGFEQMIAEINSDYLVEEPDKNPFLDKDAPLETDLWDRAFRPDDSAEEEGIDMEDIEFHIREADRSGETPFKERHPVFPVRMANVSPGGYCLEWSADIPSHIKTGDVIAVREVDNSSWSIAVIRWVSQLKDETTLLGVELLSPRATPYGASVQHKTGEDGDLMRALLLPEIKLVGQPNTLITPRVGFKERQKVTLVRGGEEAYIQLFKKVSSTAAYNQFEFRYIQQLEEVAMRDKGDVINTQFESFWNNI